MAKRHRRDVTRFPRRIVAAFVLFAFMVGPSVPALAERPSPGEWFEYDFNTYLDRGTVEYEGYTERMRSHTRYAVLSVTGDNVTVRGEGSWTFEASDGTRDAASYAVTFSFSPTTRRYLSGIDVEGSYVDPAVWFWIATPLAVGQEVRILDDLFTVQRLDETLWLGALPRRAALLVTSGAYERDDVYGRFTASYTDRYYFDPETGFILAEVYEESDVGVSGSFRWRAELSITSSSYPIPYDWGLLLGLYAGIPGVAVASIYATWRVRHGPSRFWMMTEMGPVRARVRRIRTMSRVEGLAPEASPTFGPLLISFTRRALLTHDPVAIATAGRRMVGLLTYDGESGLGSLFSSDGAVARALLKRLRVQDFFAEHAGSSWELSAEPVDSFQILERRDLTPMPYDPMVARPMLQEDLPSVIRIAEVVYGGRASRWVDTCFRDGDLAYVGMADGRIVGFGFATVADHVGRLHTLTVLAAYRDRGIGTELTAARLSAVAALGVQRVVVEISKNNAPSLRVATRAGFVPIGETVYYSRVPRSSAIAFQRQF